MNFPTVTWGAPNSHSVSVVCDSSQLSVLINLPGEDDIVSAFVSAEHVAEAIVGSMGFANGTGYWIELVQVTREDGTSVVFGVRPPSLGFEDWQT